MKAELSIPKYKMLIDVAVYEFQVSTSAILWTDLLSENSVAIFLENPVYFGIFLAAMSSSRSDRVTQSVRTSVRNAFVQKKLRSKLKLSELTYEPTNDQGPMTPTT